MSEKQKTTEKQVCSKLCTLMNNIVLRYEREEMNLSRSSGAVFQNSFTTDETLSETE